ncbi:MAG: hypothetical protein ACRES9_09180 [Gammaproteobacteria bacterium]
MSLLRCSVLILCAVMLGACAAMQPQYGLHDPRLTGTWHDTEPWLTGIFVWNAETYFPDGTVCGYIFVVNEDGSSKLTVFKNQWKIKNNQLYSTESVSNDSFLSSLRRPIVDDILSLNTRVMRLHGHADAPGSSYVLRKLPIDRGDQLCKLFDAVMRQK